jgi:hypothetical protein
MEHDEYMLLIYQDELALTETEREECYIESTQLAHQLKANGQYLAASPLQPTALATSVRVREGYNQRSVCGSPRTTGRLLFSRCQRP